MRKHSNYIGIGELFSLTFRNTCKDSKNVSIRWRKGCCATSALNIGIIINIPTWTSMSDAATAKELYMLLLIIYSSVTIDFFLCHCHHSSFSFRSRRSCSWKQAGQASFRPDRSENGRESQLGPSCKAVYGRDIPEGALDRKRQ